MFLFLKLTFSALVVQLRFSVANIIDTHTYFMSITNMARLDFYLS